MRVALFTHALWRYKDVANSMAEGIRRCGDTAVIAGISGPKPVADVAVMYGWKHRAVFDGYPHFVYADLGYWRRDTHYRMSVDAWGPERYVLAGLPGYRFDSLGMSVSPWRTGGDEIIIAGSTGKACADHGVGYQEWERAAAKKLQGCGKRLVYRPKPNDEHATPIEGCEFDQRPISEALSKAWALVTHHSNCAVDAILAGVPVHCEVGAAAAISVPIDQIASPPLARDRVGFLRDVAWLQWTANEMRSGACWSHLKSRGLFC